MIIIIIVITGVAMATTLCAYIAFYPLVLLITIENTGWAREDAIFVFIWWKELLKMAEKSLKTVLLLQCSFA